MNIVTIAGNLGKDAELRHLPNGDPLVSFSVADSMGKDKGTIWWNCTLFGKRAESLHQYLVKGQQVTVIGTVAERSFTDKDGNQRKSMDVRVQDLALQGGRRDDPAPRQAPNPAPKPAPKNTGSGFEDLEDLPF